jgi:hypothetical protein
MSDSKHESSEPGGASAAQDSVGQSLMGCAEAMLAAQNEWLAAVEVSITGWLHRRRQAVEHARQSFEHVPQCRTMADLTKLQQGWMSDVSQQLAGDMAAWSEMATLMSQLAVKHVEEVGRIIATGSPPAPRQLLEAAGDKPSRNRGPIQAKAVSP